MIQASLFTANSNICDDYGIRYDQACLNYAIGAGDYEQALCS